MLRRIPVTFARSMALPSNASFNSSSPSADRVETRAPSQMARGCQALLGTTVLGAGYKFVPPGPEGPA